MADKLRSVEELDVWKVAMEMVTGVYAVTRDWPAEERFGLTNQVRRAAVSVPSNIAEGQGRANSREFLHFLAIANGSLQEVRTQLRIGANLNYLSKDDLRSMLDLSDSCGRLLSGLRRAIRKRTD